MNRVVVDASVTLAWCFPDEASERADGILLSLQGKTVLVPAVWSLEIGNALLVGERKKRITQSQIKQFMALIDSLSLVQEIRPVGEYLSRLLPLARLHGLTTYDAAYLELAVRHGAPLASFDAKLRKAALTAGVRHFG